MERMRQIIIPILLCELLVFICQVSLAQTFTFETWNNVNTPALTVGNFQSVAVDKRGKVWAGSLLGGLYCYRDTQWVKINTYPDITFRHLVPSNMVSDSNVWAASPGKTGSQAISGGAYLIDTKSETVTQFGLAGGLSSNYVNSVVLSSDGKVYASLQQSISGTTVRQGGVYKAFTQNPALPPISAFIKAIQDNGDITYHSAGNRGEELWFGRGANCASGCQAPYIARLNSKGELLGSITAQNSVLPFTNSSNSAFARAIFTDTITGNTFVGLNSGGVGIYEPDGNWRLLTSINSPFPAGAAVNFNAITEVYGEVWIGTSLGIFVYNGRGSFDSASSFKLLTTANGLPSNFVNSIAVDTSRSFIWIATPAGISRCNYTPPYIRGLVFDVAVNESALKPDTAPSLLPNFDKIPLENVKVSLVENGNTIEIQFTDEDGYFELKQAQDGKTYQVIVDHHLGTNNIKYVFSGIKNHTIMSSILIPDKLITEVKGFKKHMQERRFPLDLLYYIKPKYPWEGFDVTNYDQSFARFLDPLGVQDKHRIRVESLADFYCSSATVYNMGGTARSLMDESVSKALDLVQCLLDYITILSPIKKSAPTVGDALFAYTDNFLELLKCAFDKTIINSKADVENKALLEKVFQYVSYALDFANQIMKEESESKKQLLIGVAKRTLSYAAAGVYYQQYCNERHKNFIAKAALGSFNGNYSKTYAKTFENNYGTGTGSLVSQADQKYNSTKLQIIDATEKAAVADFAAQASNIASQVVLVTPGAWMAPLLKGAAVTANTVKAYYISNAMISSAGAANYISGLSQQTLSEAGLVSPPSIMSETSGIVRNPQPKQSITALIAAKTAYHQKMNNIKSIYSIPTYDSAVYVNAFSQLGKSDSVFNTELRRTLNTLWSSADSASILIPGFKLQLNRVVDSFISSRQSMQIGFVYNNLAYFYDPNKSSYTNDLIRVADSVMLLNDSAISGISRLIESIATNGILYRANLVQVSYKLNHNRQISQPGSFSYTLKNFGSEPQNNVSFKINKPTSGYTITSPDSIYAGTILANDSVIISFNFNTPANDSVSNYEIVVRADNGIYKNISGALYSYDPAKYYSIKDGNWSDPSVWINGMVPTATSNVEVTHNITVDINASCKTLRNIYPGKISLAPGKKLDFVK